MLLTPRCWRPSSCTQYVICKTVETLFETTVRAEFDDIETINASNSNTFTFVTLCDPFAHLRQKHEPFANPRPKCEPFRDFGERVPKSANPLRVLAKSANPFKVLTSMCPKVRTLCESSPKARTLSRFWRACAQKCEPFADTV